MKPRISQLAQSGASNGQVIVWNSTSGQWEPGTAASTYTDEQVRDVIGAALVAGTNVTITVNDPGDTITIAATGGGSGTHQSAKATRTSGDVTLTANTFTAVDTGLDLTLTANSGDMLMIGLSCRIDFTANGRLVYQDAVTLVGGSITHYCSGSTSTGEGVQAWWADATTAWGPRGGSILYTVQSGDVSGGNVTLRYVARLNSAGAPGRKISATSANPLHFWAMNLSR